MALMLCMSACAPAPVTSAETEESLTAFTNEIMGCMMLKECTKDVKEVKSIQDIEWYQKRLHTEIGNEFNELVTVLNDVGINVYIAPERYFL